MWEIANNLMPQVLSRKGLLPALKEFTALLNSTQNIAFYFNDYSEGFFLDKEKEIHIYRIVQEISHNAIKHSGAHQVHLSIATRRDKLIIDVKDDGIGFNYTTMLNEGSGLGLKNLISRVELLHGEFYIDSALGKGTHYTIEIPNTEQV
jgi:signal transduction histidine kinase